MFDRITAEPEKMGGVACKGILRVYLLTLSQELLYGRTALILLQRRYTN